MNKLPIMTLVAVLLGFILNSCGGSGTTHSVKIDKFVIPAIDDNLIFEDTMISTYETFIDTKVAQNETKTLSFVLKSSSNLSGLILEVSNLSGNDGMIENSTDIKIVKSWYQNDTVNLNYDDKKNLTSKQILIPELLLKDETLIKVEKGSNFLKDTAGNLINISEYKNEDTLPDPKFKDADTLQSFSLSKDKNKQFFITLKVPQDTNAGTYTGKIKVKSSNSILATIDVNVEVLPFLLEKSSLMHTIYYDSSYAPKGQITGYDRTKEQIVGELKNMVSHLTNPFNSQDTRDENLFKEYLKLRKEAGADLSEPFFLGDSTNLWFDESANREDELAKLKTNVKKVIQIARDEGFTGDVYFYGVDEPTGENLANQRELWSAIHEVGGKVFCALSTESLSQDDIKAVADILDLGIISYGLNPNLVKAFHDNGNKIGSYANPQAGRVTPLTYRKNYGLKLWQQGYDVASTWAYQGHTGLTWNVFDYIVDDAGNKTGYDEVFAYPTVNGAIDTIEWEGWRESVVDSMYLATLLSFIDKANEKGIDTSYAQNFLNELKLKDLDNENFEEIREMMINHILALNVQF